MSDNHVYDCQRSIYFLQNVLMDHMATKALSHFMSLECDYKCTKPLCSLLKTHEGLIIPLLQILVPRGTLLPFLSHVFHIGLVAIRTTKTLNNFDHIHIFSFITYQNFKGRNPRKRNLLNLFKDKHNISSRKSTITIYI